MQKKVSVRFKHNQPGCNFITTERAEKISGKLGTGNTDCNLKETNLETLSARRVFGKFDIPSYRKMDFCVVISFSLSM